MTETQHASDPSTDVASVPREERRLHNHFNIWSIISLAFTTTNSWMALSSSLGVPLAAGGGPSTVFGLLFAALVLGTVGTGLAEMASAFPTAGGQYHFIFMLWPPKYRHAGAYVAAWFSFLAWATAVTSSSIFVATSIFSLVTLYQPTFLAHAWQVYLMHVGIAAFTSYTVAEHPRGIGLVSIGFFYATLGGFIASLVAVLVASPQKRSASFVFSEWNNQTGWTDGFSFFIGTSLCLWSFAGLDGATHISEEVPNPRRNVPIAIICTIITAIATAIPWSIALLFSIQDPTAIIMSTVPIVEVYRQCLNSTTGATVFMIYFILMFVLIALNCALFASRLLWSFARDGGLPYSNYFSQVTDGRPSKLGPVLWVLQLLFGVLYIASTVAFNSLISLSILVNNITFVAPQAALVIRGRHHLQPGYFSLGKFGYVVNALATVYITFFSIVLCFPSFIPVTGSSMNYVSVCVAVVCICITTFWFSGCRHTFRGPTILLVGFDNSDGHMPGQDGGHRIEELKSALATPKGDTSTNIS